MQIQWPFLLNPSKDFSHLSVMWSFFNKRILNQSKFLPWISYLWEDQRSKRLTNSCHNHIYRVWDVCRVVAISWPATIKHGAVDQTPTITCLGAHAVDVGYQKFYYLYDFTIALDKNLPCQREWGKSSRHWRLLLPSKTSQNLKGFHRALERKGGKINKDCVQDIVL